MGAIVAEIAAMAAMEVCLNTTRMRRLSVAWKELSTTTKGRARVGLCFSKTGRWLGSLVVRQQWVQCGVGDKERWVRTRKMVVATTEGVMEEGKRLLRPTPAEVARTAVDTCMEGTLSTLSDDGWPLGTEVRFAVDIEGNPILRLQPGAAHTELLLNDSRCSLHVQMEQPGRRRPQYTLQGRISKVEDIELKERLEIAWERRFAQEHRQCGDLYIMSVEQVLQSRDMGEEEVWVSGSEYQAAAADALRECAKRIVEDMNQNHWEDIRRFSNVYANLDADQLEAASMTWVDRLGFDMRVLTKSPQSILEIRIPFTREVADERDARSSLTIMAQIAWEQERSVTPSEMLLATVEV